MIEIENNEQFTSLLRFEVLKRDKHTCQYCGKKSPEVELEIDFVSSGNNPENLITICRNCLNGKTVKNIVNTLYDGSFEEWKENMRKKREEALEDRMDQLEEVKKYWLSCRGYRHLSSYDERFINSFIKKYDPDWIKKAIKIATDKGISDCGKYVAGILKNWIESGFPEDELNLKLAHKSATDNQISYVKSLLELNNISLRECCGKNNLYELTMLDAKNIIGELTTKT